MTKPRTFMCVKCNNVKKEKERACKWVSGPFGMKILDWCIDCKIKADDAVKPTTGYVYSQLPEYMR